MEPAAERLIDVHNCRIVVELTAVIRGREDRHEVSASKELVAILNNLVRTAHEVYIMLLAEFFDDRRAKHVGNATFVLRPARHIVGISPQQVAEETNIWWVLRLHDVVDL